MSKLNSIKRSITGIEWVEQKGYNKIHRPESEKAICVFTVFDNNINLLCKYQTCDAQLVSHLQRSV